ncbi:MAG: hypothetical protein JRD89_19340, partial [Deltaproteobacteria bacterium]|nr:hypothetical protein [Deltaproteobacteria bacterium]
VPLLYEFPALCLMQEPGWARAYMLVGSGSNGKSTYLRLITDLLGRKNVAKVSLQDLNNNRFAPSALVGKLANIFPDLPAKALRRTSVFKAFTGGDEIYVEKKFKDPFGFLFKGRLAYSTNQLPEVADDSYAFWRRWVVIEFPNVFPDNPNFYDSLRKEIPGLLNKVIQYIKKIKREGLTKTKRAEEIMELWKRSSDSVYYFVSKKIIKDPDGEVGKDFLYNRYVEFCDEHDIPAVPKNVFGMKIQQHTGAKNIRKRVKGERIRVWRGIEYRSED